ncbi:MAG TPA: hypothetical protein VMZ29_15475 [Candidatus Bathyarchaeia archaeon]|nr:hypothetical protein [Candidatus Bathyarchaeia archaeon]
MKEKKELIFEGEKTNRKTSYRIFNNGQIEIEGPITKPGLHISNRLYKWLNLPKINEDEIIKCKADLKIESLEEKVIMIENTIIMIFCNNYGVYIKPVDDKVLSLFKEKISAKCSFQLESKYQTNLYLQLNEKLKIKIKNIDKRKPILKGGDNKTTFEIYQIKDQILVKHKGIMDSYGRFLLSSELRRYFEDWFEDEFFIIQSENKKMIIKSKTTKRVNSKKITKVLKFQYFGLQKELEIIFSNPSLKFNENTLKDLDLKRKLVKSGFMIDDLVSNYRSDEEHKNVFFEKSVKKLFQEVFNNYNKSIILNEVRLKPKMQANLKLLQEYMCIDILIAIFNKKQNKTSLILIEIKTGNIKDKKIINTEYDIARLYFLKENLGNQNIIPIVIFDSDIKGNNMITTKQFGLFVHTILIGLAEFQVIKNNPSLLLERISEYENTNPIEGKYNFFKNPNIEILGRRQSNHQGSHFERYIENLLIKENFQVSSNILVRCCGKEFELDHLATKNNKLEIISCKDRTNWKSSSIDEEMKKYLIKLNFRRKIFGIDKGRLFIKTNNKLIVQNI